MMGPFEEGLGYGHKGAVEWGFRVTVFLVQLGKLPGVLAFLDHVVVELIPERRGGQFRAGEFGDGAEE